MDLIRSAGPLVRKSHERMIQQIVVAGERCGHAFEWEVLWLQESESHVIFMHGGKVVKEMSPCPDGSQGYLSSCDLVIPSAIETADEFDILPQSSLELVVQTTVFLRPVIETELTRKRNAEVVRDFRFYAPIPQEWRREPFGCPIQPGIAAEKLGSGVIWSSKRITEENNELRRVFKAEWQLDPSCHLSV